MKKLVYIAVFLQLSIGSLLLADPSDRVTFADSNLETAVAEALGSEPPITEGEMANLHILTANNLGISDLTGLEYAVDVNELHLSGNLISDLSPISDLTSLIYLYLNNNEIADISAVSGLANLDTLFLSINLISDISPVYGLTGLTSLYLATNQISNISSLSGLSNLTILDLTDNQVVDISVVSNLTSLELLSLTNNFELPESGNQVVDISAMSNLTNLQTLYLADNQISDISVLAGEEPNDLITLVLTGNPLHEDAYCIYLSEIRNTNALSLEMLTYDPASEPCSDASDTCENAVIISKNETYEYSTDGATGTEDSYCGGPELQDYKDVWHSYTPVSNEVVNISLCGSTIDTTLVIYDSCPDTGGTVLACNDDYCGDGENFPPQSLVTIGLTADETYLIRVARYDQLTGDYVLSITDALDPPPVNNDCQDANVVVQYSPPVTGSTTFAYGTDITSCTMSDTRSVWYYFIPTISGIYLIDPNEGDYDTALAVFDGCGGTELACNDDYYSHPDYRARIVVDLVGGETYYIRISSSGGRGGNYSLVVTLASDINKDGDVDIIDLSWLIQEWLEDGTSRADIAFDPEDEEVEDAGDKFIDLRDAAELYRQWGVNPL